MDLRKIQVVGGSTYTISIPKEWVKKNGLAEKSEVQVFEKNDRTLMIAPATASSKAIERISLDTGLYGDSIDQLLFAVYYLGIDNIELYSNKEISKRAKSKIRIALSNMSGTEISYEDNKKITIKVLLDKSKVDIWQSISRIGLILDASLANLEANEFNISEIRVNENEVDRLYHLVTKIISVSLIDSNVLHSSGIRNVSLVPSLFLFSKKLEHMADSICYLSEYLHGKKAKPNGREVLPFIRTELKRAVYGVARKRDELFSKAKDGEISSFSEKVDSIRDEAEKKHFESMLRILVDLHEEATNITFYSTLIRDKAL